MQATVATPGAGLRPRSAATATSAMPAPYLTLCDQAPSRLIALSPDRIAAPRQLGAAPAGGDRRGLPSRHDECSMRQLRQRPLSCNQRDASSDGEMSEMLRDTTIGLAAAAMISTASMTTAPAQGVTPNTAPQRTAPLNAAPQGMAPPRTVPPRIGVPGTAPPGTPRRTAPPNAAPPSTPPPR
jgi:hypothetical protein